MKIYRPLWNEGALLAPQQFQQQSEWDAFSRAGIAARGNAFADRFGQEEESMAVARYNLAFRFGHEDNGVWDTCAVARLLRDGQGGWRQDPDFIPPMALFSASRGLCERLALLNRQLRSRRQRLMSMRRESNDRMV